MGLKNVTLQPNVQLAFLPVEYRKLNSLSSAVLSADYNKMQSLITSGTCVNKINDYNITPLMVSGFKNDEKALNILLKAGANPLLTNIYNQTVLDITTNDKIKRLIELNIKKPQYDKKNNSSKIEVTDKYKDLSPLLQSALDMNHDKMLELIKIGVCVNKGNRFGMTALMISSNNNDKKGVLILLNADANPLLRNYENKNALAMTTNEEIKEIIKESSDKLRKFRSNFENHKIFSLPVTNITPIIESDKNKTISASVLGIAGLSFTTEVVRYTIENISDQSEPYRMDVNQTRNLSVETDNFNYKNLWWISGITLPIMALVTGQVINYFRRRPHGSTTNSYNSFPLLENSSPSSSIDQFNGTTEDRNKMVSSSINSKMTEIDFEFSSDTSPIESGTRKNFEPPKILLNHSLQEEHIYDVPVNHIYAVSNLIKKSNNNSLTELRISTLSAQAHEAEELILELKKSIDHKESIPFFNEECISTANIINDGVTELQKLIALCASEREHTPSANYRGEQIINPAEANMFLV
jgi:ankyrin repeat protein